MDESTNALRDVRKTLSSYFSSPWRLERVALTSIGAPSIAANIDQMWVLTGPDNRRARFAVARKNRLGAADVALYATLALRSSDADRAEAAPDSELALLVSAPWISGPMREAMADAGVNYIDDTGNLYVTLRDLPVMLRADGAAANPAPRRRSETRLSGNQALAVIRFLVDMRPPYTQAEVVTATNVSAGYVSKLLAVLEKDKLVARDRGAVVEVDWAELLRERAAQASPLLGPGRYEPMIARRGLAATLRDLGRLAEDDGEPVGWVTGSAAAQKLSPLATVSQLLIRTNQPRAVRKRLGLLPVGSSNTTGTSDVLLLTQNYEQATARAAVTGGIPAVAPSQLVLDCLGGNGRLPAEGEEIIRWMQSDERRWRRRTFPTNAGPGEVPPMERRPELDTRRERPDGDTSLTERVPTSPSGQGATKERAATETRTWSADAVKALLGRLSGDYPAQVAVIVAAALNPTRTVTRDEVYRLGGYAPDRSLRGFTRPIRRVTDILIRARLLDAQASEALTPLYLEGSRAAGFVVPPEFTDLVPNVINSAGNGIDGVAVRASPGERAQGMPHNA